jgi:hypothetical protein
LSKSLAVEYNVAFTFVNTPELDNTHCEFEGENEILQDHHNNIHLVNVDM